MRLFLTVLVLSFCSVVFRQKCVRADYKISSENGRTEISDVKFSAYGLWSAKTAKKSEGVFLFRQKNLKTDTVVFCYGFNSLYAEWLETEDSKSEKRVFGGTVRFPLPQEPVRTEILVKDSSGVYAVVFDTVFNPAVLKKKLPKYKPSVLKKILDNGSPSEKINIAVVPQDYDKDEMPDFISDAERIVMKIFDYEPFSENRDKFNVTAVLKSCDIGVSYYTFGTERYLMTDSYSRVCTAAQPADWDFIVVLVNSGKYGGGGIFNFYAAVAAKNEWASEVFVHEFGHSFANLDDEYDEAGLKEPSDCMMCSLDKNFCQKCRKKISDTIFSLLGRYIRDK